LIRFRQAVAADAPAVAALVNSAYRGESSKRGWTTEADLLGGLRADEPMLLEMMGEPGSRVDLAFEGSALIGCVNLKREAERTCYLGMLTVDPARQAAGLGKQIMARSEELARDWGCARMRMTVIDRRAELIAYYERRGYARTGKTSPFPSKAPGVMGDPKVQGLTFVELVKPL